MSAATNLTWHEGVTQEQRNTLTGQQGVTVWFTGLSGSLFAPRSPFLAPALVTLPRRLTTVCAASGKSTLACALELALLESGKRAFRLDGDNVRFGLNKDLGFSEADRNENIRRVGEVAPSFSPPPSFSTLSILMKWKCVGRQTRRLVQHGNSHRIHLTLSRRPSLVP